MILKLEGAQITYPADLRADFPDTIFPAGLTAAHLPAGYFMVEPIAAPVVKLGVVTEGMPQPSGSGYRQAWSITPMPLGQARAEVEREIDLKAKDLRNLIVSDLSPAEMASWTIKRAEALMYTATGLPSDAPSLSTEASARGCPLADLAQKVLDKGGMFMHMEAVISGTAGKKQDQVKQAATVAQLETLLAAVDDGWPV